jgi:hypothetical protein
MVLQARRQGALGCAAVALSLALFAAPTASAGTCDVLEAGRLDCTTGTVTRTIDSDDGEFFRNYQCGAVPDQYGPEQSIEITCPAGGDWVTLQIRDMDCDLDFYLVDSTCNPGNRTSCMDSSEAYWQPGQVDQINEFWCPSRETLYLIIEGWDIDEANWECFFGLFCEPKDCDSGFSFIFNWETAESDYTVDMICSEDCDDGTDNDRDGKVDCADTECERATGCYVPELCNDRLDNDVDGLIDCQDLDCPTRCRESTSADCSNGVDDDFDGTTDCADPGCAALSDCCDRDRDGYDANTPLCGGNDCNDNPGAGGGRIGPGQNEILVNGVDENCDGRDLCYRDLDGDGFGSSVSGTITSAGATCIDGGGESTRSDDCKENGLGAAQTYPGATEVVGDGIDQDCNGVDVCYQDGDRDGWGSAVIGEGNGLVCEGLWSPVTGDCQDLGPGAADRYPNKPETCNGYDDDCDGAVDADDSTAAGLIDVWVDNDGDGYGIVGPSSRVCSAASNQVTRTGDCDDAAFTRNPGAPEVCNQFDDDCNGLIDLDDASVTGAAVWHPDDDFDGFGDPSPAHQLRSCEPIPGWTNDATDCNDGDSAIGPGRPEIPYDGLDQDCLNGDLVDMDADGVTASQAAGADCNDQDPTIRPGLPEEIDGVDQDCDGRVDEGTEWGDDDGDGVAEIGGDCDDTSRAIRPGKPESCDGVDEDCDGEIDEGTPCADDDRDFLSEDQGDCNDGDPNISPRAREIDNNGIDDDCDGAVDLAATDEDRDGYAATAGDCEPRNADVRPGAPELVNGRDDDCDGDIDDGTVAFDDDGDGFAEADGDCDDENVEVGPGAAEAINGRDDDCDGRVDEVGPYSDDDGDGFSEATGDCDDANITVRPDATEVDNDVDDDCDGRVDDGAADADLDGHSESDGDCDDDNGWINPEADEVCDRIDNDCDGLIDEGCDVALEDTDWKPPEARGCDSVASGASGWSAAAMWLLVPALRRRRARDVSADGRRAG